MPAARSLSLRARALNLLANREQSRSELLRKLSPHAESVEQLEALLDEFERAGYLSEQRFAESLVRRRSLRYGRRYIEQELGQHRVSDEVAGPLLRELAAGERERALAMWARRFGQAPADLAERARQHRFLAQRGFDAETIGWVLRQAAAKRNA
jgi:regulatory protein